MNHIEKAVLPLKEDAIEKAEQYAKKVVAGVREQMKEHGNDLQKIAPYPRSGWGNEFAYHAAVRKYQLYRSLTTRVGGSRGMNDPEIAKVDSNKVKRFIKETKEQAALQYDAFVAKLVKKIGPTKAASLQGNHVWSHSILVVMTASGEVQKWKTQQIENVSKLGKYFPQWPTRKMVK